jgi:hypothetical protein
MHEHAATGTVLLGVMDGHGEAGDLVSHFVSERIAPRVFRHPEFATSPCTAIAEVRVQYVCSVCAVCVLCVCSVCAVVW